MFMRRFMFVGEEKNLQSLIDWLNEGEVIYVTEDLGGLVIRIETRFDLIEQIVYYTKFKATKAEHWLTWIKR